MRTFYIAGWMLLMIVTIFFLYFGDINPLTVTALFLLLLLLCLEAVWQLYFGEWYMTKNDQV